MQGQKPISPIPQMESNQQTPSSAPEKIKKHLFIRDLKEKDEVRTTLLVRSKELLLNKNGKPYLAIILTDKTGEIDSRVWNDADHMAETFQEGDVVAVGGKTHVFQDRFQLIIDHLVTVPPGEVSLCDYLPQSEANLEEKYEELLSIFRGMENPWIKKLALSLLEDPEIRSRFQVCPAAKTVHHAFIGGLLLHSLQIIKLVDAIVPLYKDLRRDVLVFGAAFHDFGKIYELNYQGKTGYTDEGKLIGHITICVTLMDRKIQAMQDFPKDLEMELKHLVLSHHGKVEFGSPKKPATLEADILANLDLLDSRIDSIQTLLINDKSQGRWSSYHKTYDQYFFKP